MVIIDHIVLSVADPVRSAAFYAALGFQVVPFEDGFYFDAGGTRLFFFQPAAGAPIGYLDHLAFGVRPGELDERAKRLRALGMETKGIEIFDPTGTPYVWVPGGPQGPPIEFWGADGPR